MDKYAKIFIALLVIGILSATVTGGNAKRTTVATKTEKTDGETKKPVEETKKPVEETKKPVEETKKPDGGSTTVTTKKDGDTTAKPQQTRRNLGTKNTTGSARTTGTNTGARNNTGTNAGAKNTTVKGTNRTPTNTGRTTMKPDDSTKKVTQRHGRTQNRTSTTNRTREGTTRNETGSGQRGRDGGNSSRNATTAERGRDRIRGKNGTAGNDTASSNKRGSNTGGKPDTGSVTKGRNGTDSKNGTETKGDKDSSKTTAGPKPGKGGDTDNKDKDGDSQNKEKKDGGRTEKNETDSEGGDASKNKDGKPGRNETDKEDKGKGGGDKGGGNKGNRTDTSKGGSDKGGKDKDGGDKEGGREGPKKDGSGNETETTNGKGGKKDDKDKDKGKDGAVEKDGEGKNKTKDGEPTKGKGGKEDGKGRDEGKKGDTTKGKGDKKDGVGKEEKKDKGGKGKERKPRKMKVPKVAKSTISKEDGKKKKKAAMDKLKKMAGKKSSSSALKAQQKGAAKKAKRDKKKNAASTCKTENNAVELAKLMPVLRDNPCLKKKECSVIFEIAGKMNTTGRKPKPSQYGKKYIKCLNDPDVKKDAALLKSGMDNLNLVFGEASKDDLMKQGKTVKDKGVLVFCEPILKDELSKSQCNLLGQWHKNKTTNKLTADDMKKIPQSCAPQMSLLWTADTSASTAALLDGGGEDGEEAEPPSTAAAIAAGETLLKGTIPSAVAKKITRGPLCPQLSCTKLKELKKEDVCPNNTFMSIEKAQCNCFYGQCGPLTIDNMASLGKLICCAKKPTLLETVKQAKTKGDTDLYDAVGSICNVEDCMSMDKLQEVQNLTIEAVRKGKFVALTDDNALKLRCIVKHMNLSEIVEAITADQFAALTQTQGLSAWNSRKVKPYVRDAWLATAREAAPQFPLCDLGEMAMSATLDHVKAVTADDCGGCCSPLSAMLFADDLRKALKDVCFNGSMEAVTAIDIERCGSLITELTDEEIKKIPPSELASAASLKTDLDALRARSKVEDVDDAVATSLKANIKKVLLALSDAIATPPAAAAAAAKRKRRAAASCTGVTPPDCTAIQTLKGSVSSLPVEKMSCITKETFDCALGFLGNVADYKKDTLNALATLAKTHIGTDLTKWTSMQVAQAGVILSAEAFTAALKTLKLESDEAIISLGKYNVWTKAQVTDILTKRLADKSITPATIADGEIKRQGHILCGMTAAQIATVNATNFKGATRAIGTLMCLSDAQLKAWKAIAVKAFGAADTWKAGDIAELGLIIAGLDVTEVGKLTPEQISSIGAIAISKLPPDIFKALSILQLNAFSTVQAQAVTKEQMAGLSAEQQGALDNILGIKKELPEDNTTDDGKGGSTTISTGGTDDKTATTTAAGGSSGNKTDTVGATTTATISKGDSNATEGTSKETDGGGKTNGTDATEKANGTAVTTGATGTPKPGTDGNGTQTTTNDTQTTTNTNGTQTTTTTKKPAVIDIGPKPTKPSTEELMKQAEKAKAETKELMKDPANLKPEQASTIADNLDKISPADLEKLPLSVKSAVMKETAKKMEKTGPGAKAAEVRMLKMGQSIAKNTDVAAMSKTESAKFLEDQQDLMKYMPSTTQVALLDKVDVDVALVKKLSKMEMGQDFRNKLTKSFSKGIKAADATAEQLDALPPQCKASLPAAFAGEMTTEVAKGQFVPIVAGSAEVSEGNGKPTTAVIAVLGKPLTPASNLDEAAWKAILKNGLLGAMDFKDVENAPAKKFCPTEAGIHAKCGELCSIIYNKCKPIYGAVTSTATMDLYGDAVFQMPEADFNAVTGDNVVLELCKRWQGFRVREQKTEYMNPAIKSVLFEKKLKPLLEKNSATLNDAKNLMYYGRLLTHPSFSDIFKTLQIDVLKGVCSMQKLMPLMLPSSRISEIRSACVKAGVPYKDLGTLLLNVPVKELDTIKNEDLYQALEAFAMGSLDGATKKAVADKILKHVLEQTKKTVETLPKMILLQFSTLLGQFSADVLGKIDKEILQEVANDLTPSYNALESLCKYRSEECGFPVSDYCSTGLGQERRNLLQARDTPAAVGARRKRNAAAPKPVTCIDIVGLGDGVRFLTPDQIKTITADDFKNCASRLGSPALEFGLAQLEALASVAVKHWGATSSWTEDSVRMAGGIVVGLSTLDLESLKITDLEAAMRIGSAKGWALLSSVDRDTKLSAAFGQFSKGVLGADIKTITGSHLRTIANLACGISASKIKSDVPKEAAGSSVIEMGLLKTCTANQLTEYAQKIIVAHGKCPEPRDMQILIGGLTGKQLGKLEPAQTAQLTPTTIENLPAAILIKFTIDQLKAFTPSMATRMTDEQRKALPEEKQEVIMKILKDNLPAEAVKDAAGQNAAAKATYNTLVMLTVSVLLLVTSWKCLMI